MYSSAWKKCSMTVLTIGGRSGQCCGKGSVFISVCDETPVEVEVLVMQDRPLGYDLLSDEQDFCAVFHEKVWVASWNWRDVYGPEKLHNGVKKYVVPHAAHEEYERELESWIDCGWLVPDCEKKLGLPRGLIPLMTVIQKNKAKVGHVMDFRELTEYVDTYTADADVCESGIVEAKMC